MLKTYTSLTKLKSTLQEKIKRRLEFNSEYEVDEELIEDYIDSAISEIISWRQLNSYDEFLTGTHDNPIINFVIESYNQLGVEGQSYESNGATAKQFDKTPLARLRTAVTQRI